VKNKLKTITQGQKSDKILGLMAMTFRAFCDLADWDSLLSLKHQQISHKRCREYGLEERIYAG